MVSVSTIYEFGITYTRMAAQLRKIYLRMQDIELQATTIKADFRLFVDTFVDILGIQDLHQP